MKQLPFRTFLLQSPGCARIASTAANATLLILWVGLYRPVFPYLAAIFGRQEFRTNQVVLLGAFLLIGLQVRKGDLRLRLDLLPQWYPPALALTVGASILFLSAERLLDVNTLSASLFGLATYGLIGLWLRPEYWLRGFPAALLLIGALPFGEHMQTFIGYPVRLLTAAIVRDGLAALGVHSVSIDTILVFENGISKVDLPCSGVKSLWTGGLFLLAATWIERRRINLRWLFSAAAFALLLLAANLGRVAVLVTLGQVLGWRLLAEMLHVPLGVLGFVGACAAAVGLLRWASRTDAGRLASDPLTQLVRPAWLPVLLSALFLAMALLYVPRPQPALAQSIATYQFPAELQAQPWPLSTQELAWLNQDAPVSAERWRFEWRGEPGSMLLVASDTWRAHHHPERCFQVYGLAIESFSTYLAAQDFPMQVLSLKNRQKDSPMTAVFWLQSRGEITDDYAARMWAELSPKHQPWVLVTVLFDHAVDPRSPDSSTFFSALRQAVHRSLEGGVSP
jgi:exosortase O